MTRVKVFACGERLRGQCLYFGANLPCFGLNPTVIQHKASDSPSNRSVSPLGASDSYFKKEMSFTIKITMRQKAAQKGGKAKDPDELTHHAMASRTPHVIEFKESERGKTVYIALRWQNERGHLGPFSEVQSAVIP
ncbi:MAG: hypothetical protein FWG13_06475 [Leptospirales bacterium]|nr:hypothetical protein [Leptospirales bacterium]